MPFLELARPDITAAEFRESWTAAREAGLLAAGALQGPWHTLAPLIHSHRVSLAPDLDAPLATDLENLYLRSLAERARADALLEQLGAECVRARAPAILLKGGHLGSALYPSPACRPMLDLDLLVPRTAVRRLLRGLRAAGYRPLDHEHSVEHALTVRDEVALSPPLPFRTPVELHWRAGYLPYYARRMGVTGLWKRSLPLGRAGLRVLSPEDLGIYLGLHLLKHWQAPNPLWLCDLYLWATRGNVDWRRFAGRMRRLHLTGPVATALGAAEEAFGRRVVPERFRPALDPARVSLWERWVLVQHLRPEPEREALTALLELAGQDDFSGKLGLLRQTLFPGDRVLSRLYPGADPRRLWLYGLRRWGEKIAESIPSSTPR